MTYPCKMAAIVEAAQQWHEARQALNDAKRGKEFCDMYFNYEKAEEKLAELVSKSEVMGLDGTRLYQTSKMFT